MLEEAWKKLNREDLNLFTEEVLGFSNAPHQKEWYSILNDKKLKRIVVAAPRGHTKTTCFSVNYPLHEIAVNPNVRILLVSNAESQAQSFLREVSTRIEKDENYIEFAGKLKPDTPDKWTGREIIVNRSKFNLKDPTISTVGMGGTILSKRADIIICDDVLNFENTRTFEQRQKIKDWFYQVLLPVLAPGGRVIFVGTVWHAQDLLHELLADASFDYRKKFKAVIQEPDNADLWQQWYTIRMIGTAESRDEALAFYEANKEEMFKGSQVLWEDYFTYDMLYLLKRQNSVAFEKAYQNNIISREDQKFKEEWLERAKQRGANLRLLRGLTPDQRQEYKAVTQGIDLAASEKEQADDNALVTLGANRIDDMVQLLSLERGKYSPAEFRKLIAERASNMTPDRMIVETNGYQNALKRDLAEYNLPIVGYTTGGEKFDPYIGVESLAILFENDRIILPYDKSDPYTVQLVDMLVDELRAFPVGHTGDSAMAFWFAYTALRDILTSDSNQSGFFQMVKQDLQAMKEKGNKSAIHNWKNLAAQQSENRL